MQKGVFKGHLVLPDSSKHVHWVVDEDGVPFVCIQKTTMDVFRDPSQTKDEFEFVADIVLKEVRNSVYDNPENLLLVHGIICDAAKRCRRCSEKHCKHIIELPLPIPQIDPPFRDH